MASELTESESKRTEKELAKKLADLLEDSAHYPPYRLEILESPEAGKPIRLKIVSNDLGRPT